MNIGKWVEYSSLPGKLVTNGDKNLHEPVLCSGGNGGMCHLSIESKKMTAFNLFIV